MLPYLLGPQQHGVAQMRCVPGKERAVTTAAGPAPRGFCKQDKLAAKATPAKMKGSAKAKPATTKAALKQQLEDARELLGQLQSKQDMMAADKRREGNDGPPMLEAMPQGSNAPMLADKGLAAKNAETAFRRKQC